MPHLEFRARSRITVHRCLPSLDQPILVSSKPRQPLHTPDIVIPDDERTSIAQIQLDQIIDDLSRLRPPIHIIPQEDQPILRLQTQPPDYLPKRARPAVNITDDKRSSHDCPMFSSRVNLLKEFLNLSISTCLCNHRPYALFIFLLTATGCSLLINPMPRLWFFTYGTGTPGGKDSLLNPASFLELRPDGSYTRDFGTFDYGTWLRKEHQLILTGHDHQKTSYPLTLTSSSEMQLTLTGGYLASFEGRAIPP